MNRLRWNPDLAGHFRLWLWVAAIVGGLAAAFVFVPVLQQDYAGGAQRGGTPGFGPEWSCVQQVKGGPICVKRAGP